MKIFDPAIGAASGLVSAMASGAVAVSSGAGPITSGIVAAACAGSAAVTLHRLTTTKREPADTHMWRHALTSLMMFVVGSLFGIYSSDAMAAVTRLDQPFATFVGGAIGYVAVGLLASDFARQILTQIIKGGGK